jgi:hypothetical protein
MSPAQEAQLIKLLDMAGRRRFQWGINDCNTLALEWLDKVQNKGWLKRVWGKYDDAKGAIKVARSLPRWCDGLVEEGWIEIPHTQASVGDLAVMEDKHFDRVHIVLGPHVVSVHESLGMVKIPLGSIPMRFFKCPQQHQS